MVSGRSGWKDICPQGQYVPVPQCLPLPQPALGISPQLSPLLDFNFYFQTMSILTFSLTICFLLIKKILSNTWLHFSFFWLLWGDGQVRANNKWLSDKPLPNKINLNSTELSNNAFSVSDLLCLLLPFSQIPLQQPLYVTTPLLMLFLANRLLRFQATLSLYLAIIYLCIVILS